MSQQRTICVVEDDPAIRRGLVDSLTFAGFLTVECADGPAAEAALAGGGFDLVLLDVVLPGLNGLEFLPKLRRMHPRLPVIMVTARSNSLPRLYCEAPAPRGSCRTGTCPKRVVPQESSTSTDTKGLR